MLNIFGKIVSTRMKDSRFVEGDSAMDSLARNMHFGKSLEIYLDHGVYLQIEPVQDREGEMLVGMKQGTWTTSEDNPNEIVILT